MPVKKNKTIIVFFLIAPPCFSRLTIDIHIRLACLFFIYRPLGAFIECSVLFFVFFFLFILSMRVEAESILI